MINITDKQDCCGCAACVQRCPKHCITLEEDSEGFLYPKVDKNMCIDCGLCEKVCPFINKAEPIPVLQTLAVKNRNEKERLASSSGGVFIALAKKIIDKGGVIFGAVYDENWEVKHSHAETIEEVRAMMGSKYLQSRMGQSFAEAEKFLKAGREVLFTGSPCQIAGLRGYLRKDYPNLLAVDFLCHGVPSPGIWRRYLQETFNLPPLEAAAEKNTVLSSSLKDVPAIGGISFREKETLGWKKYSFVVRGSSASKADKNSVLLSVIHIENPYMRGFLSDIYLRPSCYACRCKNGVSHSDLTIADYWGINLLMPDFDDDKGIGLVLISTAKGQEYCDSLDMDVKVSALEDAKRYNGGFKESVRVHPKRALFYQMIANGHAVSDSVGYCLRIPIHVRAFRLFKKIVKKIIKITIKR